MVNQSASITWVVTGGVPPYTVTVQGQPDGMVLMTGNMALGGAPVRAGTGRVIVSAGDSTYTGQQFTQAVTTVTVLPPLSVGALTASARHNNAFSATLSATGGAPPYSWRATGGALPAGLSLSAAGQFTGLVTGAAPGGYFSLFGENLAASSDAAQTLPLPTTLGNMTVQWNGVRLPLLAVSAGQINAQVPFDAAQGTAELKVTSDGVAGAAVPASVQAASPGLFQVSPGILLAINEDGTLNSSSHPAPVSSVVLIYGTGCGGYDRPLPTGGASPSTGSTC